MGDWGAAADTNPAVEAVTTATFPPSRRHLSSAADVAMEAVTSCKCCNDLVLKAGLLFLTVKIYRKPTPLKHSHILTCDLGHDLDVCLQTMRSENIK